MAKKKKKKKGFPNAPPWAFIDAMSELICRYITIHWEDGIQPKDAFIMSRFLNLSVLSKLDFNTSEVHEAFNLVNSMTNEEEVNQARKLNLIEEGMDLPIVGSLFDSSKMEKV